MAFDTRSDSVLGLVAHDARLAWRDFRATFSALGDRALAVLLVVLLCVMHAAAWPIATQFAKLAADPGAQSAAYSRAAPAVLFVLLLMVAQTLNGVTKLLYSRGDLELMFSSPVSARKVLFVRALAVAGGALTSASFFVVPLADAGLLAGHGRFAAIYPALIGAALLAAAVGLVGALGLFALIGPRMTRLAAQILATFIGAAFMMGLQLHRFLPSSFPLVLTDPRHTPDAAAALFLLPVRAAMGEPGSLAVWLVAAFGLFSLVSLVLGYRFASNASVASNLAPRASRGPLLAPARQSDAGGRDERFRGGLMANLRLKEWRLISRDPWVVSQIALQILYMTPMVALLWSGGGSIAIALGPMIVVVAFQVASSLTWLSLSGEDAPELLATAPVSPQALRRGKLEAVGALTLVIVALPLGWLATISISAAAATLPLIALGVASAVLLHLWHGKPAKRSAFAARHRESKMLALVEMAFSMLWGVATALVILESFWALIPLAVLFGTVLCSRPRRQGSTA